MTDAEARDIGLCPLRRGDDFAIITCPLRLGDICCVLSATDTDRNNT
jgi:hypothetical protein